MQVFLSVHTPEDLEHAMVLLKDAEILALDTEFIRERTYWPQLCLIQCATPEYVMLIDPLQLSAHDLEPFYNKLQDDQCVKILHDGGQDIELIEYYAQKNGDQKNIGIWHDVQTAMALLSHERNASLPKMLKQYLKKNLEKTQTLSDWSHRPLAPKQIEYAQQDVAHLPKLYQVLKKHLIKQKKWDWFIEEMQHQRLRLNQAKNLSYADKIPQNPGHSPQIQKQATIVKVLAAWREQRAQTNNVPRQHVLSDQTIHQLALLKPKHIDNVRTSRLIPNTLRNDDDAMSQLVQTIEQAWATLQSHDLTESNPSHHWSPQEFQNQDIFHILQGILTYQAKKYQIAPKLIATHDDIKQLIMSSYQPGAHSSLTTGWRNDVFGKIATSFLRGDCRIRLSPGDHPDEPHHQNQPALIFEE